MTAELSRANRPHIPWNEVDFSCVLCCESGTRRVSLPEACAVCHLCRSRTDRCDQHLAAGVSMEEGLISAPILPAPLASHSSWEEDGGKQMLDKSSLGRILSVTQNVMQFLRV